MLVLAALALFQTPHPSATLVTLRRQAVAVGPLVTTTLAKSWLEGVDQLTDPSPRSIYKTTKWISQAGFDALTSEDKAKAKKTDVDSELYYNTKYGSPIAYVRAVDLAGAHGLQSLKQGRVMDFGYGGIGQLRLFAALGAEAVGVDVDPFLPAIYSLPEDKGPFATGSVRMVDGRFPASPEVASEVGKGYDLIISKNTLKRGYIHPSRPADKRMLIDLGVSDSAFLAALYDALKPGGLVVVYNLCPAEAPSDKPYIPWADGHCPFDRDDCIKAGFAVKAFDVIDDKIARKMAHALAWDQGDTPMDLQHDLFAWYTILQRP